jgi:hypothetical protein
MAIEGMRVRLISEPGASDLRAVDSAENKPVE